MKGLVLLSLPAFLGAADPNWPRFRGPAAGGVAEGFATPVAWNADASAGAVAGVRWKTPLPGLAHSSPIVWEDRLFVATALRSSGAAPLRLGLYGDGESADDVAEQSWKIYCLDKRTGKVLWERTARQGLPRAQRHTKATHANTTLTTDGRRLVAFFGSEGLYCYNLKGGLLWSKDLGVVDPSPLDLQWGFASSPVLFEDTIVILADDKKNSFLAAFRASDGREIWRTGRSSVSERSWSTPLVHREGRTQVVTNGWRYIAGYDFITGQELWRLRSEGDIPVPAPVAAHGLIFVTNAHGGLAPLYAIRPAATGDISLDGSARSNAHVAWSTPRNGAYMQTPLIYGDLLYSCSDRGVLKCYDARTGKLHYEQRLGTGLTGFSASPVASGGRIYIANEEGEVFVIASGSEYKLLAKNLMGETCMATPALSEGVLYFRTRSHLVAIGPPRATTEPRP